MLGFRRFFLSVCKRFIVLRNFLLTFCVRVMKFSCENCDGRRNWGNPSPGDKQRVAVSVSVWVTFRVMASVSTTTITKRQTWSTCPTYCTRVAAQLQLSVCLSVRLSVVLATNLVNWRARLTFLSSFCCGAFFSLWKWKCFHFFFVSLSCLCLHKRRAD